MPLEKESLNNFLPNGFETLNQEGYKENFSEDKIATGYEKDVPDMVSGPNLNNLLDNIGKNTNVLTNFMDFIKNMPINNIFVVDENNQLAYKPIDEVGGGGLEVGDIGISLFVDETKGLRRWLNGQVVDINTNTQAFLTRLKQIKATDPDRFTNEDNWQAEKLLSPNGYVDKFVIADDESTVRLPNYPEYIISELGDTIPARGNGMSIGMTDGTNFGGIMTSSVSQSFLQIASNAYGEPYGTNKVTAVSNYTNWGITTDSSKSGIIADTSNLAGKLKLRYFIQIATGQETEVNITNKFENTNPQTLLESKYSDKPLYNESWLLSNGQWNSKGMYPTVFEGLEVEYNSEIEAGTTVTLPSGISYTKRGLSVKLSTAEDITDYDFVLNTADETFRLPMLNGTEDLPSETYDDLSLGASGTNYTTPANGWYYVNKTAGAAYKFFNLWNNTANYGSGDTAQGSSQYLICEVFAKKGDNISIQYNATGSTNAFRFIYAQGNGSLYYYVGDIDKNHGIVDMGRIAEALSNKTDKSMVDGQWVFEDNPLSLTINGTAGTLNLDLSNILPNDNYCYELLLSYSMHSSNSTISNLYLQTDIQPQTLVGSAGTNGWYAVGTCIVITGSSHSLSRYLDVTTSNKQLNIYLVGYRRLGKNN